MGKADPVEILTADKFDNLKGKKGDRVHVRGRGRGVIVEVGCRGGKNTVDVDYDEGTRVNCSARQLKAERERNVCRECGRKHEFEKLREPQTCDANDSMSAAYGPPGGFARTH